MPAKYDHIDFTPPQGVQDEAAKGLEWRREYGRGGTEVGVARARDLSNGKNISPETARRMASYFARHAVDKQGTGWKPGDDGFPSAGRIAWALWGGDPGEAWASKLTKQMDAADRPQASGGPMQKMRIDGPIGTGEGEVSAKMVAEFLDAAGGEPVEFAIHSEGGSVYEGMAIHDLIAAYEGPTRAVIQSMAFSIASYFPMAADEVEITPNGWVMIHNPWVSVEGSDEEIEKVAAQVKALRQQMIAGYADRMGVDAATVQGMMDAETYLDAEQAKAKGLVDRVTPAAVRSNRQINGSAKLPRYVVQALLGPSQEESEMTVEKKPATARAIKQALPKASAEFIVRCMEKEMSMEEVKDEYMETSSEEMLKLQEMVEELTSAKAVLEQELEMAKAKAKALEEEKEEMAKVRASARYRTGSPAVPTPVAAGASVTTDPKAEWERVVGDYVASGMSRMNAVKAANRSHGHIRSQLIQVANS